MEGIIVALIGLAGSAIGSVIGVMASAKLTSYRLEQLEKSVEKRDQDHEALIDRAYRLEDRTYRLEQHNEVQDEKIAVANHRIEDLERKTEAA